MAGDDDPDATRDWYGLHVYRYGRQDEFLVDGLAPVLAPLRASGAVTDWFFLRYWQGGHHVRVRLRLRPDDARPVLDEVTAKLAAYLAETPDAGDFDADEFRAAQPTMAALEGEQVDEIQPPDTIVPMPYVPELAKYGGPRGVAIAERFFCRSSDIALDTVRRCAGSSSKRLGSGFSMMVRGMCAAELSPERMAAFFAHYCRLWSPYTFDRFLDAWPDLLRARADAMRSHVAGLLSQVAALGADPFHAAVRDAWQEVRKAGPEVLDAVTLAGADATAERRERVLLVSYLHTHNNRLGLIPEHEAFLGYLGHHVLSEHAGVPPEADLLSSVRAHRQRRLAAI